MFANRTDAGMKLGMALKPYNGTSALVLGIARGGAEIAYQVAKALTLEFSLIMVRKLPFRDNPEAGFGALAEDGSLHLLPGAEQRLARSAIRDAVRRQEAELTRRVEDLRGGSPLPDLRKRHVILVDDGIALGSTTHAAIKCCRRLGACRVTVATPLAAPAARTTLEAAASKVIVLLCPPFLFSVSEFYRDRGEVSDADVTRLLTRARQAGLLAE